MSRSTYLGGGDRYKTSNIWWQPLKTLVLQNWDTTYSLDRFGSCKKFDGPVDKDSNRQIPHTTFHEAPLLNKLVDTFTEMLHGVSRGSSFTGMR